MVGRVLCAAVLTLGLWDATAAAGSAGTARAANFESLMVPSAAMGRDIPVAFLAGGPHAVYLLDAFDAAPDVSNWVTAGNAMNMLAGKGISVVAPASGAYSMYADWEQDASRQWETFLSSELPDGWPLIRVWLPAATVRSVPRKAGTPQRRSPRSIPIGSVMRDRCRDISLRKGPGWTVRSLRACSSMVASIPATCGACPSWAGGSGIRQTNTFRCWRATTLGCGFLVRETGPQVTQPRCLASRTSRMAPTRPSTLTTETSAVTTATSIWGAAETMVGPHGVRSWARCRAIWP
jgi:hypothetical protein